MIENIRGPAGLYLSDYFKFFSNHLPFSRLYYSKPKINNTKKDILHQISYTELVYERINKKLSSKFSKSQIEKLIFNIIQKTEEKNFKEKGKNIYVTNTEENIKITINQNTCRTITVDRITI